MNSRIILIVCSGFLFLTSLSCGQVGPKTLDSSLKRKVVEDVAAELKEQRRRVEAELEEEEVEGTEGAAGAHEWVVEIPGGEQHAKDVAAKHGYNYVGKVMGVEDHYIVQSNDELTEKELDGHTARLAREDKVKWVQHQKGKRRDKRSGIYFKDPLWKDQWYLHDTRSSRDSPKLDLHVIGAWKMGITGKEVRVTIVDDGLKWDHPDIQDNYDPYASYDVCDRDADPYPRPLDLENSHGTRCAGEVSMVANNSHCGVGAAYDSRIGAIRLLDGGPKKDRLEAESLGFNVSHVDVFSCSWGPTDNGKTLEKPGKLAQKAIYKGIYQGRGGKGVIYAWASGNGGGAGDACGCDGYASQIYAFSVSAAINTGAAPYYGEACASTIATTYTTSNGGPQISHGGTSAASPLAAAIVALGLEANPDLTWRDVKHIAAWTSEPAPLWHNKGWYRNGRGLYVNPKFGFGLLNAEGFVKAAKNWVLVGPHKNCTVTIPSFKKEDLKTGEGKVVKLETTACKGTENEVNYIEHVQLIPNVQYSFRGKLSLRLTSPDGTRTTLLNQRRKDNSSDGFKDWPFTSVHNWGENPRGWWTVEAFDHDEEHTKKIDKGEIKDVSLIIYGTKEMPENYKKGRVYNMVYNTEKDRSTIAQKREEKQVAHSYGSAVVKEGKRLNAKSSLEERRRHHEKISHVLHEKIEPVMESEDGHTSHTPTIYNVAQTRSI